MFCDKCGNPIPEGMTTCPNCPPETEDLQLNLTPEEPVKKSSGKKIALIAGIALAAALIGVLIAWACGAFRTPQQQLLHMETANTKAFSAAIAAGYDEYRELVSENNYLEKGYQTAVDYRLSLKEALLKELLGGMTGADLSSLDLSWFQHLLIHAETDYKGNQFGVNLGVGLNDTVLLSADMFLDFAKQIMVVGVPELSDQYLTGSLEGSGMDMTKSVELIQTLFRELPNEKALQAMIDRYTAIYLESIQTVEKSAETVTVGSQSAELTVLKVTYTQEQLADLTVTYINTAKTDETVKQIITAFQNYMTGIVQTSGEAVSIPDLYSEFLTTLDEGLAIIEENRAGFDPANYLVISNYVRSGVITGRKLEIFSAEEQPVSMHYLVLADRNGAVLEAVMPETKITGSVSGTEQVMTLYALEQEILTLKLQDFKAEKDAITGTLRLYPSEATLKELGITDSFATMADLVGCYLEIAIDVRETGGSMVFSVVAGETLGSLKMDVSSKPESDLTVPEATLDPSKEGDMDKWGATLKFDKLIANLEQAKVPAEYVRLVQQITAMLSMQLSAGA